MKYLLFLILLPAAAFSQAKKDTIDGVVYVPVKKVSENKWALEGHAATKIDSVWFDTENVYTVPEKGITQIKFERRRTLRVSVTGTTTNIDLSKYHLFIPLTEVVQYGQ